MFTWQNNTARKEGMGTLQGDHLSTRCNIKSACGAHWEARSGRIKAKLFRINCEPLNKGSTRTGGTKHYPGTAIMLECLRSLIAKINDCTLSPSIISARSLFHSRKVHGHNKCLKPPLDTSTLLPF